MFDMTYISQATGTTNTIYAPLWSGSAGSSVLVVPVCGTSSISPTLAKDQNGMISGQYDSTTWSYGLLNDAPALSTVANNGVYCSAISGNRVGNLFLVFNAGRPVTDPSVTGNEYSTCKCQLSISLSHI